MRAMRRASMPRAAIRAVLSSASHVVGDGLAGTRLGTGDGSSVVRIGIFSCMFTLRAQRRLVPSAEKSVENCAQPAKISEMSERRCVVDIAASTLHYGSVRFVPVGPSGWNQRSAAIRQDDEHEQAAASFDCADDAERLPLERVSSTRHGNFARDILGVGSVSPLPLIE